MKTYEADELAAHARWSYYVSSFSMLDRTEGVPPDKLQFPFLRRNLPSQLSSEDDYSDRYNPLCNEDGLVIRIAPNNYHMLYDPGTMDWLIHGRKQQKRGLKAYTEVKESRLAGLKCLTDDRTKSEWMRGKSDEAIQETLADFAAWIADGPPDVRAEKKAAAPPVSTASTSTIPAVDGTIDTDVVMAVTDAAAPPLAIAADANTEDQIMGGT